MRKMAARSMRIECEFSHTTVITTGARHEAKTDANRTFRPARRPDDRASAIGRDGLPALDSEHALETRHAPITRRRFRLACLLLRADLRLSGGRFRLCGLTPRIRPLPRLWQRARSRAGKRVLRKRVFSEHIRAGKAQEHPPGTWDTGQSPLRNSLRCDVA